MGLRSFVPLLLVLLILMLLFGTKRLREMGSDLAVAVKNFRKGLQDNDEKGP
jgi:sec-independent protein translocase protein TatA